jgi:hypothetical protein
LPEAGAANAAQQRCQRVGHCVALMANTQLEPPKKNLPNALFVTVLPITLLGQATSSPLCPLAYTVLPVIVLPARLKMPENPFLTGISILAPGFQVAYHRLANF